MNLTREHWTTARRMRVVVGLMLAVGFCLQCQHLVVKDAETAGVQVQAPKPHIAYATLKQPEALGDPYRVMAQSDPLGLLRTALDRYERSVHDYVCTFTKQELVGAQLTTEQVMRVEFREAPFSVDMLWVENADKAKRALYIEGKWTGKNGQRLAVVEPAGAIARLFVDSVKLPIDGAEAQKTARRRIDQFGFRNSLQLIIKFSEMAAERGELKLTYMGEGVVAERPTYVIERRLPYTGDDGLYPDRVLEVHLDQENLLPTCCVAYADEAKTKLLGRYLLTNTQFNVGLTDTDFSEEASGTP